MSTFKFNFAGIENISQNKADEEIEWFACEKVVPNKQVKELDDYVKYAKMFTCGDVEIGYVNSIITCLRNKDLSNFIDFVEKEHSDLITGKYEGGLKVWECTYDIIEYLERNNSINFFKVNTLDLGCGAGILGIYAFLKGATVTFQDYNKEIIEYLTIPSVLLNIEEDELANKIQECNFYSGDWSSFDKTLGNIVYDIILTSETIYNVCNYDKLVTFFNNRLSQNGVIFVAAKTCYFGVGGSVRQFELVISKSGQFKSEVVWKTQSGIQREILKISRLK